MFRYRTEIVVAADRYVWLKLPDSVPEGKAFVTVDFSGERMDDGGNDPTSPPYSPGRDDDIEWWDEFEEEGAESE